MKKTLPSALIFAFAAGLSHAAPLSTAELTRLYNQVEVLSPDAPPREAKVGDAITGKTAVQTGDRSRAELEFTDDTIARLGANSLFSFEKGTRDLDLKEGVLLLQVPKNAGGANVNTAAVSAAITGTTVLIESRTSADRKASNAVKFLVLEGTMRLRLKGTMGESVLVGPGQMITLQPGANKLPEPVVFDINRLVETSGLLGKEFRPLGNLPYIENAAFKQQQLKNSGRLINLNYGLYADRNGGDQLINQNNEATLRTAAENPPSQSGGNSRANPVPRIPSAQNINRGGGRLDPTQQAAARAIAQAEKNRLVRLRILQRVQDRERLRPPDPIIPPPAPEPPVPRPVPSPPPVEPEGTYSKRPES